jgi:plastocyanin
MGPTCTAIGSHHGATSTREFPVTGWRIQATDVKEGVVFNENGVKGQAPLAVTRFRVTFTHPGIFNYICALPDELGMVGKVIVLP